MSTFLASATYAKAIAILSFSSRCGNSAVVLGAWAGGRVSPSRLLIPLSFASAIVRYRLMDVEVIVKRGLVYVAAAAGIRALPGITAATAERQGTVLLAVGGRSAGITLRCVEPGAFAGDAGLHRYLSVLAGSLDLDRPRTIVLSSALASTLGVAPGDEVLSVAGLGIEAATLPLQIPVGSESSFSAVIDLVRMKTLSWDPTDQGVTITSQDRGAGAIREVVELILKAQRRWDDLIQSYR